MANNYTNDDIMQVLQDFIQMTSNNFLDIHNELSDMKGDITSLKTDVAELKTDVAELKTDVAELKTDVAELKTDVAELKDIATTHTRQLSIMGSDLEQIKNSQTAQHNDIVDLFDRVLELEKKQTPLSKKEKLEAFDKLQKIDLWVKDASKKLGVPLGA